MTSSSSADASRSPWLSTLRTRRWIGLTALALVGLAVCILLGRWQWQRADDTIAAERALLAQPVSIEQGAPLDDGLPASSIGRRVFGDGSYATDQRLFVASRESQGRAGLWIVEPFVLADGSAIAVVRGWVAAADSPVATPPEASITGILQAYESFYPDAPIQPDGTILAINERVLAQAWGRTLRPGVVILATQEPLPQPSPVMVPAVEGPGFVSMPWTNYFYAVQWWVFGAFVLLMWVRFLRLESREIASSA